VLENGAIRVTDVSPPRCASLRKHLRDINIAYANELSIVCDKLGIDVYRLIELANCHPRVNIHTPGQASAGMYSGGSVVYT
jgi:UDP-N-acetyl-D-mannosaminuronic acid dehydrogenase